MNTPRRIAGHDVAYWTEQAQAAIDAPRPRARVRDTRALIRIATGLLAERTQLEKDNADRQYWMQQHAALAEDWNRVLVALQHCGITTANPIDHGWTNGDGNDYETAGAALAAAIQSRALHTTAEQQSSEILALREQLRGAYDALARIVGSAEPHELRLMDGVIRAAPLPGDDQTAMLNAIQVLLGRPV